MRVWRIATQSQDCPADDLSGNDARAGGARWNRPGTPVVYCADTPALACLEILVHLDSAGLDARRCLVAIELPEALWNARRQLAADELPPGWDAKGPDTPTVEIGQQWLESRSSAVMVVPSAVVPESAVILLNPAHPDAAQGRAEVRRHWAFDYRLLCPVPG